MFSSPANIVGLFMDLILNIGTWLAIAFWIVYAKKKKMWAKIVAIIFTVLAPLSVLANYWGFLN